jgi:hypothetical protein
MELTLLSENLDYVYQAWQLKRHLMTRSRPNLAGIHFDFSCKPKMTANLLQVNLSINMKNLFWRGFLLKLDMLTFFTPSESNVRTISHLLSNTSFSLKNMSILKAALGGLENLTTIWNVLFEFQLAEHKPRPAGKLEEHAERKPRPAGKLMVLAERKPRPAGKGKFAVHKSRPSDNEKFAVYKPRPAGNEKFAVHKPRLADRLVILVECKSRLADKIEFAERKPRPASNSLMK